MKIERSLRELEVLALELTPPLVLESNVCVSAVIEAMRRRGLGYALLETAGRLAGIFTERDVFLSVLDNDIVLGKPVAACMTANPGRVNGSDPVWRVIHMMHAGGYRQVPVVDHEDHILGCVRHKDIAGYLVDHYAVHVLNLPPDPEQVARAPEGG
ncbi:MAG: CBS domain-containing protein [Gammaproteobacteria bacterium]|jgi:signal-transduction protein with cAMP-binding, CBS, and nucleotidyltransferase domain